MTVKNRKTTLQTHFLNVDLDVFSRSTLETLVKALGKRVHVNYVGREKGRYSAHLSLPSYGQSADSLIRKLAQLVGKLSPTARRLWRSATSREFNIGIEGGQKPISHEIVLAPKTIQLLAKLDAGIVITTYGNESRAR
jgi:hypothetical protein